MVLLLPRLAPHLLLWGKQWLSRVPSTRRRLQGYGLVRLLRDVWAVPGGSGGGTGGWSACAAHSSLRSQPSSRQAFPCSFAGVYGWVVCAKNWQLVRTGRVVTRDALLTQRAIAQQIMDAEGD